MDIKKGSPILVVKKEWLEMILNGSKSIEIRGTSCKKNSGTQIYLSPSGTNLIIGSVIFSGSKLLSQQEWLATQSKHCVFKSDLPYGDKTYAWYFCNPLPITPIPYLVKRGSIVWRKYQPVNSKA